MKTDIIERLDPAEILVNVSRFQHRGACFGLGVVGDLRCSAFQKTTASPPDNEFGIGGAGLCAANSSCRRLLNRTREIQSLGSEDYRIDEFVDLFDRVDEVNRRVENRFDLDIGIGRMCHDHLAYRFTPWQPDRGSMHR